MAGYAMILVTWADMQRSRPQQQFAVRGKIAVRRIVIGKSTPNQPDKAIALLQCVIQRCYYAKTLAEHLLSGYDKRQFVNNVRRE